LEQLGALALNQRECLTSILNQVGVTFSIGAPLTTELSFLRIIEFHWDFNVGGELALGNLVLHNCQLRRSLQLRFILFSGNKNRKAQKI
jgi:hypothetical protein